MCRRAHRNVKRSRQEPLTRSTRSLCQWTAVQPKKAKLMASPDREATQPALSSSFHRQLAVIAPGAGAAWSSRRQRRTSWRSTTEGKSCSARIVSLGTGASSTTPTATSSCASTTNCTTCCGETTTQRRSQLNQSLPKGIRAHRTRRTCSRGKWLKAQTDYSYRKLLLRLPMRL